MAQKTSARCQDQNPPGKPADTPAAASLHPPSMVEEYRVGNCLGRGGMGEVYLGYDLRLERHVAIKFIRSLSPDPNARQQFLLEARAAARVQHANVVTVYRVGEVRDQPYIVSEYIEGRTLAEENLPLSWSRARELGLGIARGLAAAHRSGVLHRDIKPGNVIVTPAGEPKLLDFGLAKLVDPTQMTEGLDPVRRKLHHADDTLDDRAAQRPEEPHPCLAPPRDETPDADLWLGRGPLLGTRPRLTVSLAAAGDEPVDRMHSGVRGTPHYMAPELLVGRPPSPRSDVYALGALLYELCTGDPPHARTPSALLWQIASLVDTPTLACRVPDIDPRFGALVDRCLRRDPTERYASAEALLAALEQLVPPPLHMALPAGNPYRGLLAFEAEHRARFFGRSGDIGTLIDRLRSSSLVVVTADSGVGKSSLCRAGVLPLVREGALDKARNWSVVILAPGRRPVRALALAVAQGLGGPGSGGTDDKALLAMLQSEPHVFAEHLRGRLGPDRGLLVFIDQAEELLTLSDAGDRAIIGQALGSLGSLTPSLRCLLTVRGDFLARLAELPGLGDYLTQALYFLRPLQPEQLREAIVGPAQATDVSFESQELVNTLVEAAARTENGGLPLLQFALAELWASRTGRMLTLESLVRMGGVSGALARHGDRLLSSFSPEQHAVARRLLMSLVTLSGTRIQRSAEELVGDDPKRRQVLETLVYGRIIAARETSDGPTYELAHEALLRGWDTLRRLCDQHAEVHAVQERLMMAAGEWQRLGRARESLWSARQLGETAVLDPASLAPREQQFLALSRQALARRQWLKKLLALGVPMLVLFLFGMAHQTAQRDLKRRTAARLDIGRTFLGAARAADQKSQTLRRDAFAAFDAQTLARAERQWSLSRAAAAQADRNYAQAAQEVEAALVTAAGDHEMRELLGDILYERALLVERERHPQQLEDLLRRLSLYDADGHRRRRWEAPGRVQLTTTPAGARVQIQQYMVNGKKKRVLGERRVLGTTPLAPMPLGQGSYLLTITAPGWTTVHYPLVVDRDARLAVEIPLLRREQIPRGYVYIPAGSFLFGTASDETARRDFLYTVPIHTQHTGPYLIAQHETTYGEWIAFLEALSPTERARLAAREHHVQTGAAVDLRKRADSAWELTLRPAARTLTVRSGEKLRYAGRTHNETQDWLRLPVGGLSRDDALAYAAWLDRSHQLPGARLCDEYEWERAARGADDRELPSGDALEPDDANFDATYGNDLSVMGPDEVGLHPASQSPFGIDDMAGNALEWVSSRLNPQEGLLRGGSYFYSVGVDRSTSRSRIDPAYRDPGTGLRICATLAVQKGRK